jgi:Protein of unknown function (DUF3179)
VKKLFYVAVLLFVVFELANVYFIMPMPYSQRVRSIDVAYFLYSWRWWFRAALAIAIAIGGVAVFRAPGWRRWLAIPALAAAGGVAYAANFVLAADRIFLPPTRVVMAPVERNTVEPERLVVGVDLGGEARAYPIRFIGYHHQVRDTVDGIPILVSFCTVCRTGRVFSPTVAGKSESFRLVGMDHFNAMFEDSSTGSWWRQATGEAVAGPRKGLALRQIASEQMPLSHWLSLHPRSLIMQADSTFINRYARSFDYETGLSRSALTGTDTVSWHDKAWVVGITVKGESKAYDWNRLRRETVVNDVVGGEPIVLALAQDRLSFFAFQRPDTTRFALRGDSLVTSGHVYALAGTGPVGLTPVFASQEFWHSWRTFHPETKIY